MRNPKSLSTFLGSFSVGVMLSIISLGELVIKNPSVDLFMAILVNGGVIGVVTQYILIHLKLTKNMRMAFVSSKGNVPRRLLMMKNHQLDETMQFMVGISGRMRHNLLVLVFLKLLFVLSSLLLIVYNMKEYSAMIYFTVIWSGGLLAIILGASFLITKNSFDICRRIEHLLEDYHFCMKLKQE